MGVAAVDCGIAELRMAPPPRLLHFRSAGDPPHKGEGQEGRCRDYTLISTSGIFGIAPAAKADRSTSR